MISSRVVTALTPLEHRAFRAVGVDERESSLMAMETFILHLRPHLRSDS